jgi:hypothetical protein
LIKDKVTADERVALCPPEATVLLWAEQPSSRSRQFQGGPLKGVKPLQGGRS